MVAATQQSITEASNIIQDIQQHEIGTALQGVIAAANAFQGSEMGVEEGKSWKEKAVATTTLVELVALVDSTLLMTF